MLMVIVCVTGSALTSMSLFQSQIITKSIDLVTSNLKSEVFLISYDFSVYLYNCHTLPLLRPFPQRSQGHSSESPSLLPYGDRIRHVLDELPGDLNIERLVRKLVQTIFPGLFAIS